MKQNPNSHKCLRLTNSWSELPQDLLSSVFERLGFADFIRVESVCWSWHSASKQCVSKNHTPWMILFPDEGDDDNNHSCTLFNPEEKEKLYKRQHQGFEFAKTVCVATYGSWVFMCDLKYNFYIVHLFTGERINLPHLELQLGDWFSISSEYYQGETYSKFLDLPSPMFWIDEKTKIEKGWIICDQSSTNVTEDQVQSARLKCWL